MKSKELFGYKVKPSGKILKLNGKPMKYQKNIKVIWNGESREVSYARFVYYAFNVDDFDFEDHNILIKHKDNNKKNNRIKNLYAINKKELLHGEKSSSSKLTDEQVKEIRKIYNKLGDNEHCPNKKCSYRKLAEKYGVSHTLIRGIINGTLRNKDNYILK